MANGAFECRKSNEKQRQHEQMETKTHIPNRGTLCIGILGGDLCYDRSSGFCQTVISSICCSLALLWFRRLFSGDLGFRVLIPECVAQGSCASTAQFVEDGRGPNFEPTGPLERDTCAFLSLSSLWCEPGWIQAWTVLEVPDPQHTDV